MSRYEDSELCHFRGNYLCGIPSKRVLRGDEQCAGPIGGQLAIEDGEMGTPVPRVYCMPF
ncbi:MAG: hypothetical protein PVS2B2_03610 [Candidatus Acidiferrum sp.]